MRQSPLSPRAAGRTLGLLPPSPPPPLLASQLINIEFGRCLGVEEDQCPGLQPTLPLGGPLRALGCCCPVPGDTWLPRQPPSPALRQLGSSLGASRGGDLVTFLPACRQRAGGAERGKPVSLAGKQAAGVEAPAFMSVSGRALLRLPAAWGVSGGQRPASERDSVRGCGGSGSPAGLCDPGPGERRFSGRAGRRRLGLRTGKCEQRGGTTVGNKAPTAA